MNFTKKAVMPPLLPVSFGLPPLFEVIALLVLLIIGIIIIVIVVKAFLFFLPAAIIAIVVYFLTESWLWAGVAFVAIAFISVIRRK